MSTRMEWTRLLSTSRLYSSAAPQPLSDDSDRGPFEMDYSRILFSNAFRRLDNKTQVFPFPENDHIHSRLTHSLEVANVGYTLGKMVGRRLVQRHGFDPDQLAPAHVAQIVATACLAHDLGNPPFGHSGEASIGAFFTQRRQDNLFDFTALTESQWQDLCTFEGNAQGLRMLMRTQMNTNKGGLRLTAACLGAFGKYPQVSIHQGDKQRSGGKKYGVYQSEAADFAQVANELGLIAVTDKAGAWYRHPLAYIMEAADDICYNILDLEDGVALGLLTRDEFARLVAPLVPQAFAGASVSYLRAQAIGTLVEAAVQVFMDHEDAILVGQGPKDLVGPSECAHTMDEIGAVATERCYRAESVVKREVAGYGVIDRLLTAFCDAYFPRTACNQPRFVHLHRLIGAAQEGETTYERLMQITDYISGMTDRYAVRLDREIGGNLLSIS